jgi:hypothetical protein
MKTTIEIFTAYKELTENYIGVSQQLRKLLPKVTELSKAEKLPAPSVLKQMLRDFDKAEEDIEKTLSSFRQVRHVLLRLV